MAPEFAISGLRPHAIAQRGIGLVPQARRTFPSLTVRETLLLPTSVLAGRDSPKKAWRRGLISGRVNPRPAKRFAAPIYSPRAFPLMVSSLISGFEKQ